MKLIRTCAAISKYCARPVNMEMMKTKIMHEKKSVLIAKFSHPESDDYLDTPGSSRVI